MTFLPTLRRLAAPALAALAARERTQRVRDLSATELDELDF